jgi:DNA polymerase-1
MAWFLGFKAIKGVRGKKYPVKVGNHICWFIPTFEPKFINAIQESREDKVPGKQWLRFWRQDIIKAYDLADDDDDDVCEFTEPEDAPGKITICRTLEEVDDAIAELRLAEAVGFDTESHNLRPYSDDSLLLTIAFSTGTRSYAIPIDHPGFSWSSRRPLVMSSILKLFQDDSVVKVAHNLPHDLEWMVFHLGESVLDGNYGCSLQAAFVLDPGPPGAGVAGHSLNHLCLEYFGLPLKKMTPGAQWVKRLRERPVFDVLMYNALDAKWCLHLWERLMVRVRKEKLMQSYKRQMDRIPSVVNAQYVGVAIDQGVRAKFDRDLTKKVSDIQDLIYSNPDVKKYRERNPSFNLASTKDLGLFWGEYLGISELRTEQGSYSTSAPVLEHVRTKHPTIDLLLEKRSLDKLLGTYVKRFDPQHKDSYIYPDGKSHCNFNIAGTRTARLSSGEPNSQNWPKRKHQEIRSQVAAPKGWRWVSVDQGQVEARVLAMESCDHRWVQMIKDKYDIHQEYAEKLAAIDDDFAALMAKDPKGARHKSKNGWVFPAFYGSALGSIINNVGIADETAAENLFEEFWSTFSGVRDWQRRQYAKYEEYGYVKSLTGRRRWGPLSWNMTINTPIQCTASDICVDAMVRLFSRSRREGLAWLAPVMQIHDDLLLVVPESELPYAVQTVVEEQLSFDAPWMNVPLSAEVQVGQNLADMETIGEWTSDDLEEDDG